MLLFVLFIYLIKFIFILFLFGTWWKADKSTWFLFSFRTCLALYLIFLSSQLRSLATKAAGVSVLLQESAHWCSLLCVRVSQMPKLFLCDENAAVRHVIPVTLSFLCCSEAVVQESTSRSHFLLICVSLQGPAGPPGLPGPPGQRGPRVRRSALMHQCLVVCCGVNPVYLCSDSRSVHMSRSFFPLWNN